MAGGKTNNTTVQSVVKKIYTFYTLHLYLKLAFSVSVEQSQTHKNIKTFRDAGTRKGPGGADFVEGHRQN